MSKQKKYFIIISILLILAMSYFLYPQKGSIDNMIFNGINKENINQITIDKHGSSENLRIKDKIKIKWIVSEIGKLKIIEFNDEIYDKKADSYDIMFTNISYGSYIGIYYRDTGYLVVSNLEKPTLKSKTFKISNDSDIQRMKELLLQLCDKND